MAYEKPPSEPSEEKMGKVIPLYEGMNKTVYETPEDRIKLIKREAVIFCTAGAAFGYLISKKLKIRPYARLLTMLGEQLIKNERIALIELIKNAYDADADWVKVTFAGFKKDFCITSDSKIIIEDNGHGMNAIIIENHWLNPATPVKLRRK